MFKRITARSIGALTLRNMKCFFRDKAAVFFSFLSPLIILLLYVLFLGDIQSNGINEILNSISEEHPELIYNPDLIKPFVSSWLICGVLAVSSITVTLGTAYVMVNDQVRNINSDFNTSPVSKFSILLSYFFSTLIISILINLGILIIGQVYLLLTGGFFMGTLNLLGIIGVILLSLFSSAFLVVFIASLIKSENAYGALSTIVGTLIGFLIGAYMPISMFPVPIQFISNIIPGSHSNALLKNLIMEDYLKNLLPGAPENVLDIIRDSMSINIYLGDAKIPIWAMFVTVGVSIIVFMLINLMLYMRKRKMK